MFNQAGLIPKQNRFGKLLAEYGSKITKEAFAATRGKNLDNPAGYAVAICKKKLAEKNKKHDKDLSYLVDNYLSDLRQEDRPKLGP